MKIIYTLSISEYKKKEPPNLGNYNVEKGVTKLK